MLEPIAIGLDKLQGEKNVGSYYGSLLLEIRDIEYRLTVMNTRNMKYCGPLVNAALAGLKRRFKNILEQDIAQGKWPTTTVFKYEIWNGQRYRTYMSLSYYSATIVRWPKTMEVIIYWI